MENQILGKENNSVKLKSLNIINHSDFYTKEEIREAYESITKDNRLSQKTKIELINGLKKAYKQKG